MKRLAVAIAVLFIVAPIAGADTQQPEQPGYVLMTEGTLLRIKFLLERASQVIELQRAEIERLKAARHRKECI